MLIHDEAPSCDPVYTADGQDVDYYIDCDNPKCASSVEHSAAESSQRRQ